MCKLRDKPLAVLHLVTKVFAENNKSTLCFTTSVESAHRLYLLLESMGMIGKVAEFSSNLRSDKRDEILTNFKKGNIILYDLSVFIVMGVR